LVAHTFSKARHENAFAVKQADYQLTGLTAAFRFAMSCRPHSQPRYWVYGNPLKDAIGRFWILSTAPHQIRQPLLGSSSPFPGLALCYALTVGILTKSP
jgi:hypothetical protein